MKSTLKVHSNSSNMESYDMDEYKRNEKKDNIPVNRVC